MKNTLRRCFFTLVMLLTAMLCSLTASAESIVTVRLNGTAHYDEAQSVYELVNKERAANGLPALKQNAQLQLDAMMRAAECAVYYGHTRPDGTRGYDAVSNKVGWRGENLAAGQTTAEWVMESWITSTKGHRENILRASATQIGIGCFEHNGVKFWVQLFNGGSDSSAVKTTEEQVYANVRIRSSLLELTILPSDQAAGAVTVAEKGERNISVRHMNRGGSVRTIYLRADSPSFQWSSSGGISVGRNQKGDQWAVKGVSAGNGTVRLNCGTASAALSVSVTHVPGAVSCTGGQYCKVCSAMLKAASGHTPGTMSCTGGQYCSVCGVKLQNAPGHNFTGGTCLRKASCTRCGAAGSYGSHVWTDWRIKSYATTKAPETQIRHCTTWQWHIEERTVGEKLKPKVKKIKLKAPAKTLRVGKSMKIKATVTVAKGGNKKLKWSTSKKKYATVSSKGVVKAKKAGRGKTVTITARARDGSGKKASVKIKIR